MQDGQTRKLDCPAEITGADEFMASHRVIVVIVKGPGAGTEFAIDKPRMLLGRGPGVDLAFDDPSMSSEHMALEWIEGGFRARDLGSTNGMQINESACLVADLKHGDSIEIGEYTFQFLLEKQAKTARTYVV
jgi:pSer/pThr/pTyr-binding forkhead associated (FHA) protein